MSHGMCGTPTYVSWASMKKRDKFRVEINRQGVKITSRVVETLEAAIEMRDLLLEEMK